MKSTLFILFFIHCLFLQSFGQFNNSAFDQYPEAHGRNSGDLHLGVATAGLLKNNEYFNRIADGFTLFGYQLNPYLSYSVTPEVRIDLGGYFLKEFGRTDFREISPYFTITIQRENMSILLGNIEGSVSHRFIEPLFDFERVFTDRLENGVQLKVSDSTLFVDIWMDWITMIRTGDPIQEEFAGGLNFEKSFMFKNWEIVIPFQLYGFHRGGQIDSNPNPVATLFNGAYGLKLRKNLDGFVRDFEFSGYRVFYEDISNIQDNIFKDGGGWYLNAGVNTRWHLNVIATYWLGNEFIAFHGGQLFQSVSSTFKFPNHVEEQRELFILRFSHELNITRNLHMTSRFEPYYDLRNGKFEFSNGLYITYQTDWLIRNLRSR